MKDLVFHLIVTIVTSLSIVDVSESITKLIESNTFICKLNVFKSTLIFVSLLIIDYIYFMK